MDKKINTIDLFAGCGGLMDGFEKSNFYDTLACVEWEKSPCENLKKRLKEKWNYNNANEIVMRFDIQRTQELFSGWKNDIEYGNGKGLDNLIGDNKIDVIIGGPPCQAYSIAGRIRDKDGMKNDYRNYLFESYLKVVNRYKPKFFVFENVPDYTEEGIKEFKKTIDDVSWIEARDFYGAYDESNKILGVIATKDVTHIALFFVDGKYHKQGIGKKLYYKVESLNNNEFFTVNSSPYAHEVYKHLGFIDTDKEQSIKGLRFYPMKKNLK